MSADNYRLHMSLWSMLAAPLIAGNDLSKMSDETKSILMNKAVIAIDQDKLGKQGDRLRAEGPREVWTKPLSGGALAVALFNRGTLASPMSVTLKELGMKKPHSITDLWSGKTVEAKDGVITATAPRRGVVLLRIEP
ncbi:MAG: glycoside hydrolase family 27 protein, partial [Bryocella sp.]